LPAPFGPTSTVSGANRTVVSGWPLKSRSSSDSIIAADQAAEPSERQWASKSLPPGRALSSRATPSMQPEGNRAQRRLRLRAERRGDTGLLARLDAEARSLKAHAVPAIPFHVQVREARVVATFIDRHVEPVLDPATGAVQRPGLASFGASFEASVAEEIRTLCGLLCGEKAKRTTQGVARVGPVAERAVAVFREIDLALDWRDQQRAVGERDLELERVRSVAVADNSADSLADGLELRCELADARRDVLDGVGGFDAARIDEGFELVDALREVPVSAADARSTDLRDAWRTMLAARVDKARAAAEFVFRNHPRVAKGVRSAWNDQNNRKAREARARKKAPPTPPAPPAPPTP